MATDIRSLRRRRRDVGRFRSTIDGAPQTPIGGREQRSQTAPRCLSTELIPPPSPRIDFDRPGKRPPPPSYIILSSPGRPNGGSFFRPSRPKNDVSGGASIRNRLRCLAPSRYSIRSATRRARQGTVEDGDWGNEKWR